MTTTEPGMAMTDLRVRQGFSRAAESYDAHALLQRAVCDSLAEMIAPYLPPASRILDAGCGTGYFSQTQPQYQAVQLDSALGMAEIAKQQNAPALCADMCALPFANDSFDGYVSSLALQWIATPEKAFAEAKRVLRPGGVVAFATLGPNTLAELRLAYRTAGLSEHVLTFPDVEQLDELLTACGFRFLIIKQETRRLFFNTPRTLLYHLKGLGATYKAGGGGLHGRHYLTLLEDTLRHLFGEEIPAGFEVYYFLLEKP